MTEGNRERREASEPNGVLTSDASEGSKDERSESFGEAVRPLALAWSPERGPIRVNSVNEDIPLSGRERAEGFHRSGSATVTATASERAEGFRRAGPIAEQTTASERPKRTDQESSPNSSIRSWT